MEKNGGGVLRITFYFVAVTACFSLYSLIQERLMTIGFGPEKEVFQYSVFIVLVNRIVTIAVASATLAVLGLPLSPSAPVALFAVPSLANVVGSSAQYEALKYVSFPLQALAKCAKSVPVMLWSWITKTRVYRKIDYASSASVTLGCMLFVLTGDVTAPFAYAHKDTPVVSVVSYTVVGLMLLVVFMVCDGLTCTVQDKLFSNYPMHPCNQLLYTSVWSAVLSAGFLLVSGQVWEAVAFVTSYPEALGWMLLQSAVSTTVQLFILFTIKQYGALNFALMMTLRQFLSIVLSCFVFQHTLSLLQWGGTAVVFGGLFIRTIEKQRRPPMGLMPSLNGDRNAGDDTHVPLLQSKGSGIPHVLVPMSEVLERTASKKIQGVSMPDGPTTTFTLASPPVQRTFSSKLHSGAGGFLNRHSPVLGLETKEKPG